MARTVPPWYDNLVRTTATTWATKRIHIYIYKSVYIYICSSENTKAIVKYVRVTCRSEHDDDDDGDVVSLSLSHHMLWQLQNQTALHWHMQTHHIA